MYRAFGLLHPRTDFALDVAATRLAAKFPGYSVTHAGNQIIVSKGEWSIEMSLVSGPHVPLETVGLTGKIAGFEQSEAETLALSDRRVEVATDIPDPFMEHFNEYLFVVEVLKSFTGLTAVDPNGPDLL